MEKLVVSFGGGVDSTALLVELKNRGIRPDLILFADTGGEKPETYAHVRTVSFWCLTVGFPAVTTVRYIPTRSPYATLEGECIKNETLPSLAFGMKSCSLKWKVTPQQRYVKKHFPGAAITWAIGLDASPADEKRCKTYAAKAVEGDRRWYPLQDWGFNRDKCKEIIRREGLPVPPKSSCFFCPAMKKDEIIQLKETHPGLHQRALTIEQNAIDGKHNLKTTKGLGRRFAWKELGGE